MKKHINNLNLSGKFLLYTLPPMVFCAAAYLFLLTTSQLEALHQSHIKETHDITARYSRILSRPLWNLEEKSVNAIMKTVIDDKVIICAQLKGVTGLSNIPTHGNCTRTNDIIIAEIPIQYQHSGQTETLGSLRLVRDGLDANVETFNNYLASQLTLAAILLFIIIISAVLGYRFTVTAPLKKITSSLKILKDTGIRKKVPIHSDDELGQFIEVYNNSLDIQDKIENTLKQQITLQRILLDTIPNPVAFIDLNDNFIGCNRAFSNLFTITENELMGKTTHNFLKKNPWDNIRKKLDLSPADTQKSAMKVVEIETTIEQDNTAPQTIILTTAITRDEMGNAVGLVSVIKDITDRKISEIALQNAKEEAENTLSALERTQQNLIQSEKLASLGSLVAGIAHEINTPLGSSITLSTSIHTKTNDFKNKIKSEQLKKSDLVHYLDNISEATELLDDNLSTAGALIHNFKQVAADQTSSKRRIFYLKSCVDEITSTLMPSINTKKYSVDVKINDQIELDSYPGPLGQVITNIFTNAIHHAFHDRDIGAINIVGEIDQKNNITITFKDDGCGIAKNNIKKVFDPFFTTKMGTGSTGLGMNVVYNIVTNILGGTIKVSSTINKGTLFTLKLPKIAPTQKDEDYQV